MLSRSVPITSKFNRQVLRHLYRLWNMSLDLDNRYVVVNTCFDASVQVIVGSLIALLIKLLLQIGYQFFQVHLSEVIMYYEQYLLVMFYTFLYFCTALKELEGGRVCVPSHECLASYLDYSTSTPHYTPRGKLYFYCLRLEHKNRHKRSGGHLGSSGAVIRNIE